MLCDLLVYGCGMTDFSIVKLEQEGKYGQPQQANSSSENNFPSDNPFLVLMETKGLMWLEKKEQNWSSMLSYIN